MVSAVGWPYFSLQSKSLHSLVILRQTRELLPEPLVLEHIALLRLFQLHQQSLTALQLQNSQSSAMKKSSVKPHCK